MLGFDLPIIKLHSTEKTLISGTKGKLFRVSSKIKGY